MKYKGTKLNDIYMFVQLILVTIYMTDPLAQLAVTVFYLPGSYILFLLAICM